MARAVSPASVAPTLRDRPPQAAPQHAVSPVALGPAAMTALIEAQERLAQNAPAPIRELSAQEIDRLIYRLDDASGAAGAPAAAPLAVRELESAREALSQSLIDLQA